MQRTRSMAAAVLASAALITALATSTVASSPSGVTPTILARGTYSSFNVKSAEGPQMFKAEAKDAIDMVVRRHDYAAGASTGWHSHPYTVFITVVTGQLTFYDYDDPTCAPHVVTAGHGYVDSGDGHIGRNETDQPASDISVILAPVGAAFRSELSAPGPFCSF